MKSTLDPQQFKKLLLKKTTLGDPFVLFTPVAVIHLLNSDHKTYFGKVNSSRFELMMKSAFIRPNYIIKGTYQALGETETEVRYELRPIRFIFWIAVIAQLFFSSIALGIAHFEFGGQGIIVCLIGLVLLNGLFYYINGLLKKQMETDFKQTFKLKDMDFTGK